MELAQNEMWTIIYEVTNNVQKDSTDSLIIDNDDITITELPNKVNYSNASFANKGSDMAMKIETPDAQPEISNTWVNDSIFLQPVSENKLILVVSSLSNKS
ncbi:hypothetical protein JTB14_004266 [Gonioctena quinquepunctata]|nr:hypothetical protein JTB14_004266 [Gonioctena quinquepunctata]